jgi:plasmid stability protein
MAGLSIRKLDENVYKRLQARASRHGVSMEEEAGQIITRATAEPVCFSAVFQKYFEVENGVDIDVQKQGCTQYHE